MRLQQLLWGALPAAEALPLEAHLLTCTECVTLASQLNIADTFVDALRACQQASVDLPPVVQQALQPWLTTPWITAATAPSAGLEWDAAETGSLVDVDTSFLQNRRGAGSSGDWGQIGPYRVRSVLGSGGMGIVFEAEDTRLQRHVALKVMRPASADDSETRQRFLQEARAAAALKHDHIVTIYDVGEDQGIAYLAMELLAGASLPRAFPRGTSASWEIVVRIGRQAAEALQAAHTRGLIHRDIKPANIWLETLPGQAVDAGRVKILDFGLACDPLDNHDPTPANTLIGTPSYMAPEQVRHPGSVDPRSDLFSLGCVLFRLTTGEPPFRGTDVASVLQATACAQPVWPEAVVPRVPEALRHLISRLLAKDPDERPASAQAVAEELRRLEVAGGSSLSASCSGTESTSVAGPWTPLRGWRRWVSVLGACLTASLLLIGWLELTGQQAGSPPRAPEQAPLDRQTLRPPPAAEHPFLLHRPAERGGSTASATLTRALTLYQPGDSIEVRGNGPFAIGNHELPHGLVLRAAPGYRPVFLAAESSTDHSAWLLVGSGPVRIEGCDFRAPKFVTHTTMFRSRRRADSPWEFHNCRFLGNALPVRNYDGPRLCFVDCLLATPRGGAPLVLLRHGPTTLEVTNCVLWGSWTASTQATFLFGVAPDASAPAELDVVLRQSTLLTHGRLLPELPPSDRLRIRVRAEGNLLWLNSRTHASHTDHWRKVIDWQGRDNLYVGEFTLAYARDYARTNVGSRLAAWEDFWQREEPGSREVEDVFFAWDGERAATGPPAQLVDFYRQQSAARGTAQRPSLEAGPDWERVGPGAGYVQALALAGRNVAPTHLRPAPIAGAPIVVLRKGQVQASLDSFSSAYELARDGDVIEIRTDDPLRGATLRGSGEAVKRLTIRGAPGYCANILGPLEFTEPQLVLTLENLRLIRGSLTASMPEGAPPRIYLTRLANCALDPAVVIRNNDNGRVPAYSLAGFQFESAEGQPGEIVNCLLPVFATVRADAARRLNVRHSVLGRFLYQLSPEGACQIDFEQCVFWRPGQLWWPLMLSGPASVTVKARGTLFEAFGLHLLRTTDGAKLRNWEGTRNVFRAGDQLWVAREVSQAVRPEVPTPVSQLSVWQQVWQSDGDSIEAEPITYDPQQWKILPGTPGAASPQQPRDAGADVSRIARPTRSP